MPKLRVAVIVDAENIGVRHWPVIAAQAATLGWINSVQIHGDFSEDRLAKWLELARAEGLQAVLTLSGGKNASDIAIAVAAMDVLHAGSTEALCLASSDADFAPLVRRLRSAGMRLHGFGLPQTAPLLRQAFTEFTELGGLGAQARPAAA